MLTGYVVRIYPTEEQEGQISYILDLKKEYPWLAEVNAQSLQQVSKNIVKAYKAFFRKKAGFPKFRKKRNGDSFLNPQSCRLDFRRSTVHIPKIGDISAVFHRRIEGTLRSVTIRIEKSGKYNAVLLMEDGRKSPEIPEAFREDEIEKFGM